MSRIVLALSILCASVLYLVHTNRAVVAREVSMPKIPATLLARHQQFPGCLKLNDPSMPPAGLAFQGHLNDYTQVYGILCETSAYNWPYAVYLVRDGEFDDAQRVYFADYTNDGGWVGIDLLYNATYDDKTKQLQGFSKARGLGDCGSLTRLKWQEEQFALMEFRYKEECDMDVAKPFPLIYKRYEKKQK